MQFSGIQWNTVQQSDIQRIAIEYSETGCNTVAAECNTVEYSGKQRNAVESSGIQFNGVHYIGIQQSSFGRCL